MDTDFLYKEETDEIIEAFYEVYNTLGYGFLERVYQNALYQELKRRGFDCKAQYPIKVFFKGQEVGEYYADVLVNECIILELKAVDTLCKEHELQLINYLKATDMEVGLLLNFGERPQIRRKIYTNDRK
ncbi:GxxExxY protein [Mediterranea massiliensis]|uniref:GxxExxY protein n=1 Tax=Mediterranea massiliensis TaxID=1841865 RepID=UPI0025A35449|nr:GxxExxY protein [Mediterranea massiliensis]MDM8338864.1 GxxExxY protein [Mediterranea massiliensis]